MDIKVYFIVGLVFALLFACCVARYFWMQAKETQITNDGLLLELSNVSTELTAIKTDLSSIQKQSRLLLVERHKLKARLPRILGKEKAHQVMQDYPVLFK